MEYLHINGSIDSHFPETAFRSISIFGFWVVSISLWINHAVAVQSVSHVPKDCSTPGFPVLHCLLEFAQTNVHSVSDTIHLLHPLSFPSLFASQSFPASAPFPMSRLFASGGQSTGASASILPMNIQGLHIQSVQSLSHVRLFATPWTAACQASLPITNSWSLLKLMFSSK